MRLGLLGGRFDPPHLGHLLLAEQALEALELDEVWLITAKTPPHKGTQTPAEHRYAMTVLAAGDHPRVRVSRRELEREGTSYTVDTVADVRASHPDADLHLILGADAAADLDTWHRPDELVRLCQVVAFPRPGSVEPELPDALAGAVRFVEGRRFEVSGTEIRRRIASGRSVRYLLPPAVEAYVRKHGFYAAAT